MPGTTRCRTTPNSTMMKTRCTTGSRMSHSHAARPADNRATASRRKRAFQTVHAINDDVRINDAVVLTIMRRRLCEFWSVEPKLYPVRCWAIWCFRAAYHLFLWLFSFAPRHSVGTERDSTRSQPVSLRQVTACTYSRSVAFARSDRHESPEALWDRVYEVALPSRNLSIARNR